MPSESPYQVAALPWRRTGTAIEILLITSRETRRWVIPKGWPMQGRSDAQAAAQEAFEEAGIRGTVAHRAIGAFHYAKRRKGENVQLRVDVYAMAVTQELERWPEQNERQRAWHARHVAAGLVAEAELRALIAAFEPEEVGFLQRLLRRFGLSGRVALR